MCEFLSWIECDTRNYYLTGKQLENTRGKKLQEKFDRDDWTGHSALRWYYRLREVGKNRECTDFSSPDNFPADIAEAIKQGNFRGLGTPQKLLSQPALAEYQKIQQQALAEYEKIEQQALAEYRKIEQQAWVEYEKIEQQAFWDLFAKTANRAEAWR